MVEVGLNWTKWFWWARQDWTLGPTDYESAALTAELRAPDNKGLIGLLKRPQQFCVILALQSTQIRTSLPFLPSQMLRLIRNTLHSIDRRLSRFHLHLCFHSPGTNETNR